jgi:hypothetical protein
VPSQLALIRAYLANVADVVMAPELGQAAPPWFLDTGDHESDFAESEVRAEQGGFNVSRDEDGSVSSMSAENPISTEIRIFEEQTGYQGERETDAQILATIAAHRLVVTAANAAWPMVAALRSILQIADDAGTEGKARQLKARTDPELADGERAVLDATAGELLRFHSGVMAALEPLARVYPMPFFGDPAAVPSDEPVIEQGPPQLTWEPVSPPGA